MPTPKTRLTPLWWSPIASIGQAIDSLINYPRLPNPSRRNYVSERSSIRTSAAPLTFIVTVAEVVGG